MLEELQKKITEKFIYTQGKDEPLCNLYDFIMKYFKIDGLEGENVAMLIMEYLIEIGFMRYKPYMGLNDSNKFNLVVKSNITTQLSIEKKPLPKIYDDEDEAGEEKSSDRMGVFGLPESMGGGIGFF